MEHPASPAIDEDAARAERAISFCLEWLGERGYESTVRSVMLKWAQIIANAPGTALVNPTFDPRWNWLTQDTCFWVDVRDGRRTIGLMAARLLITDDFLGLMRSRSLWYDPPTADATPLTITVTTETPRLRGRVGHEGGLWIHPDHRKVGLSVILPHLTRAIAFQRWMVDWQTGVALSGIGKSGLLRSAYGMANVQACYHGPSPVPLAQDGDHPGEQRRTETLFLAHMSREELLAGLEPNAILARLPPLGQRR